MAACDNGANGIGQPQTYGQSNSYPFPIRTSFRLFEAQLKLAVRSRPLWIVTNLLIKQGHENFHDGRFRLTKSTQTWTHPFASYEGL